MSAVPAGTCPAAASAAEVPAAHRASWIEAAVAALDAERRPMRAADIVAVAIRHGLAPHSTTRTPARSVNRDLHAAIRRGDDRVALGPARGLFVSAAAAGGGRPARPAQWTSVGRLPVEPLTARIEAAGGLGACGLVARAGDAERTRAVHTMGRAYRRARQRGSLSLFDADWLSIHVLGVHPVDVWGGAWWAANEALDSVAVPRPVRLTAAV